VVVAAWLLGPVPRGLRQHREVLRTIPVKGDAAAQTPPRHAHVVQGVGLAPLLQGLLVSSIRAASESVYASFPSICTDHSKCVRGCKIP
jgi:hypothetical protein